MYLICTMEYIQLFLQYNIYNKINSICATKYTSVAHRMSNTWCELLSSDSAYNFSFTLNQTIFRFHNKKISTTNRQAPYHDAAKNDFLWFQRKITIFTFFVTMIPFIQKKIYYSFIALIFH